MSIKNKVIGKLSFQNWESNSKLKLLIQTNEYFTAEKWIRSFNSTNNIKKLMQIKYTSNRISYYKLALRANIIFAFNFNADLLSSNHELNLFYLGVRGSESLPKSGFEHVVFSTIPPLGKELIAEYVLAALIILDRKLCYAFRNQFKAKWYQQNLLGENVPGIMKKRVGIAGMGNIGKSVANLLLRMGLTVYGWDKFDNQIGIRQYTGISNLYEFLKDVDILIISLPLNEETKLIFNYDALKNLKRGSSIINISRGGVLDEDALILLLKQNYLSGAVLDVVKEEPLPKSSKLWKIENLVITPHISGNVNYFVDEIQKDFLVKLAECGLFNV